MITLCFPLTIWASLVGKWTFGSKGCNYYGFISMLSGISVIGILTLMAIDRYVVICRKTIGEYLLKPVQTMSHSNTQTRRITGFNWLYGPFPTTPFICYLEQAAVGKIYKIIVYIRLALKKSACSIVTGSIYVCGMGVWDVCVASHTHTCVGWGCVLSLTHNERISKRKTM